MLPVSNSLFQPPSTVKDSFILRCYLPVPEAADSSDVATETVAREEIGSTQAWDETAPGSTGAPYPTTEFEYNIPTDDPVAEPFGVEDSTFTSPTVSTSDRTTSLDDDNLGFLTMDPNNATNYLTSADLFGLPNIATYHGDGSEVLLQWEEP